MGDLGKDTPEGSATLRKEHTTWSGRGERAGQDGEIQREEPRDYVGSRKD